MSFITNTDLQNTMLIFGENIEEIEELSCISSSSEHNLTLSANR